VDFKESKFDYEVRKNLLKWDFYSKLEDLNYILEHWIQDCVLGEFYQRSSKVSW